MIYENKKINNILNKISEWSDRFMSMEICGFVGYNEENKKYILKLCENHSPDKKNHFQINPIDYLLFKKDNSFIGVFHSHIKGDEKPSEFDVSSCEHSCLPFFVYSINSKKFGLAKPKLIDYNVDYFEKFTKNINIYNG